MKKILICCSGGITSKIFIKRLNQYCESHQYSYLFSAMSGTFVEEYAKDYDVILFAPQTKPSENLRKQFKVATIPENIYATMDCEQLITFLQGNIFDLKKGKRMKLVNLMVSISQIKAVRVLVNSSLSIGSLMIVQALFSLILSIPLGEHYQNFITSIGLKSFLEIPITVLSNSIGLLFSFVVAYQYRIKEKDCLFAGLLSMACYLLLIPIDIENKGVLESIYTAIIEVKYVNASGVFVAMISSLFFSFVYERFMQMSFCKEKLMKTSLACITMLSFYLFIKYLFLLTSYQNVFICLNQFVSILLKPISEGVYGFALYIFLSSLLYFFGVHGSQLLYSLILPLYMTIYYANINAFSLNQPAPYPYWLLFPWVFMGGIGSTLGLNILMIMKSKHKSINTLGKLSLITSLFNINEPIIYGFPIIFNSFMFIPFTITPLINLMICLIFMKMIPIVPLPTGAEISTYMPFGIGALLTNNSWLGLVLAIGILLVDIVIYYPFFKHYEKSQIMGDNEIY